MNGEQLSEALRAQAAGLQAFGQQPGSSDARTHLRSAPPPRLAAWAVLVLALLLGAMAGGLAGIVSTW